MKTTIATGLGVLLPLLAVGCQVGETSILSAAGRHLAAHLGDVLHVEGSFGPLLFTEEVSEPSLGFGPGGRGAPVTGPGLGVDVLEERLERYAAFRDDLS